MQYASITVHEWLLAHANANNQSSLGETSVEVCRVQLKCTYRTEILVFAKREEVMAWTRCQYFEILARSISVKAANFTCSAVYNMCKGPNGSWTLEHTHVRTSRK